MADEILSRDDNKVPVMGGTTSSGEIREVLVAEDGSLVAVGASGAGLATEATLANLRDRTPVLAGTPAYAHVVGGTVSVPSGARLVSIDAYADAADGTFTVDGGDAINVRADTGKTWTPLGNWVGPLDVVASASVDLTVEWIVP